MGGWLDAMESHATVGLPRTVRVPLSLLVAEVVEDWAQQPDGSGSDRAHDSSADEKIAGLKIATGDTPLPQQEHIGCDSEHCARTNHSALIALLTSIELESLAASLREETLLSLFVLLEDRPNLLARLKELGVAALPQRQRICNALAKARRADLARRDLLTQQPQGVLAARSGALGRALPPPATVSLPGVDGLSGYLLTARGETFYLNGRSSTLVDALAPDGPTLRAVAHLCTLAGIPLVILGPRHPSPATTEARLTLERALGCAPVYLAHTAQQQDSQQAEGHDTIADSADTTTNGNADGTRVAGAVATFMLPTLDVLAPPKDPDDRRVSRRKLAGRRLQAVWRGGRGGEAEGGGESFGESNYGGGGGVDGQGLRARLVQYCAGRASFDVGFADDAPPLSRRHQGAYRVRLLVDGHGTWDAGWLSAICSGSVLVLVGKWLPPIPGLRAWEHYVPAAADLSNLGERVEWALTHPSAAALAERANQLYARCSAPGHASKELIEWFSAIIRGGVRG